VIYLCNEQKSILEKIRFRLDTEGIVAIRVISNGDCMDPIIKSKQVINVEKIPAQEIELGDIITFVDGNEDIVIHRVIAISKKNDRLIFMTKGDNFPYSDGPIFAEQVLGLVKIKNVDVMKTQPHLYYPTVQKKMFHKIRVIVKFSDISDFQLVNHVASVFGLELCVIDSDIEKKILESIKEKVIAFRNLDEALNSHIPICFSNEGIKSESDYIMLLKRINGTDSRICFLYGYKQSDLPRDIALKTLCVNLTPEFLMDIDIVSLFSYTIGIVAANSIDQDVLK
jgi:signal peptidase I